jgi:Ca2+-binding RTX toxin-like protein
MTVIFENRSVFAGIQANGDGAFSTGWTDFNNDSFPDLWISPHGYGSADPPKLYLNQQNGTFANISSQTFVSIPSGDTHGSSWVDFDNDGDKDLTVIVGAQGGTGAAPSMLFVNQNGQLQNQAAALGADFPEGRGRMPLWFDWNKDGKLDLLHVNSARPDGQAPSTLFQQTNTGFVNVNAAAGFQAPATAQSAQITDLFGNGTPDLLVFAGEGSSSEIGIVKAYENATPALTDITSSLPTVRGVQDAAIADFNGDLVPDIFMVRSGGSSWASQTFQSSPNLAFARFNIFPGEAGVSFKTTGNVSLDFHRSAELSPSQIFIGSAGINPTSSYFTLSPTDPNVVGTPARSTTTEGLYISYEPSTQTWQAIFVNPSGSKKDRDLIFETTQPLTDFTRIGFQQPNFASLALSPVLLASSGSQYVDQTLAAGLSAPLNSQSVVAGDFDNDMDVDLYMTSTNLFSPQPSTFYENQGNGTFVAVADAAGAAGNLVGPRFEDFNTGLNLATADYDVDGFLDLFIANSVMEGVGKAYAGVPNQLHRNVGNSNRWVQIDLEGTVSNRDGIGAKVFVTAGGVTQLREQSGGFHRYGQNQQRLHFGLAGNQTIDKIEIKWPSGVVQEITNVASNQVLKIVEAGDPVDPDDDTGDPGGIEEIVGTAADDTLVGTEAVNVMRGLDGNDSLSGLGGNDTLLGGEGNDTLNGGDGINTLDGGNGSDVYLVSSTDHIIETSTGGSDTVQTTISYTLNDNIETLTLTGSSTINGTGNAQDNLIVGNDAVNTLSGDAGNDTLVGNDGNDSLLGGAENDSLLGGAGNDRILGDAGNDSLLGGAGDDSLLGGDGNDGLFGGDGNDTLLGGTDTDSLLGEAGNDIYIIDTATQTIVEALDAGTDSVMATVSWTLSENLENLTLGGTSAIHGTGNDLNNAIVGNNSANNLSGGAGNDSLVGNSGNDSLIGGAGDDTLDAGLGNDSLWGGAGNNVLNGGLGNDIYFVENASDAPSEALNGGTDTVRSSLSWTLGDNLESLTLLGTAANSGTGNALNNTLRGNSGANWLSGLGGNDRIQAGTGNDTLIGGDGVDTLYGEGNNDVITGGVGNDVLGGGGGNDTFTYANPSEGVDSIIDFSAPNDTISVSASGFGGGLTPGAAIGTDQFLAAAGAIAATDPNQRFIYNTTTGELLFDADGSDPGVVPVQFATLTTKPTISTADIFVTA